jgi:citrate lyase gamma subunit
MSTKQRTRTVSQAYKQARDEDEDIDVDLDSATERAIQRAVKKAVNKAVAKAVEVAVQDAVQVAVRGAVHGAVEAAVQPLRREIHALKSEVQALKQDLQKEKCASKALRESCLTHASQMETRLSLLEAEKIQNDESKMSKSIRSNDDILRLSMLEEKFEELGERFEKLGESFEELCDSRLPERVHDLEVLYAQSKDHCQGQCPAMPLLRQVGDLLLRETKGGDDGGGQQKRARCDGQYDIDLVDD